MNNNSESSNKKLTQKDVDEMKFMLWTEEKMKIKNEVLEQVKNQLEELKQKEKELITSIDKKNLLEDRQIASIIIENKISEFNTYASKKMDEILCILKEEKERLELAKISQRKELYTKYCDFRRGEKKV